MSIGKSKAKVYVETDTKVSFSDVAGVDEATAELEEIVNFLARAVPEDRIDEFGEVFGAFNRMVLRIRRARRALIRTTRRTQASGLS